MMYLRLFTLLVMSALTVSSIYGMDAKMKADNKKTAENSKALTSGAAAAVKKDLSVQANFSASESLRVTQAEIRMLRELGKGVKTDSKKIIQYQGSKSDKLAVIESNRLQLEFSIPESTYYLETETTIYRIDAKKFIVRSLTGESAGIFPTTVSRGIHHKSVPGIITGSSITLLHDQKNQKYIIGTCTKIYLIDAKQFTAQVRKINMYGEDHEFVQIDTKPSVPGGPAID